MFLPESSTVIGLLLLLDFELSPFFTVAFLQQEKAHTNKNVYTNRIKVKEKARMPEVSRSRNLNLIFNL